MIINQLCGVYDLGRAIGFLITCVAVEIVLRRLWIVSVTLIFGLDQGISAIDGLDGTERGYQILDLGAEAYLPIGWPVLMRLPELVLEKEDLRRMVWRLTRRWNDGSRYTTSDASCAPTEHLRVIKDLSTRMGNLEYGHGQLVKKVIQVSDAEVAYDITIGEIGPRVLAVEGQVQVMASQMVQAVGRLEQVQTLQAAVQQRDMQIQQLQTMVFKMSSRESTLMQCILGMDRRLADLERRPLGPQ
ncbi:hypothetical protein Tco_1263015 [Tanacetum coccineum]